MTAILLGAVFGTGLVVFAAGLRPPRPALASLLAALSHPAANPEVAEKRRPASALARCGARAVPGLRALGLPTAALRADLEVAERTVEDHLAAKAASAGVGLFAPWLASGLFCLGTASWVGWWLPTSASLLLAACLFFLPDAEVRQLARRRRAGLRHTLTVVLDLTVIALAGGAGVQQALDDASRAPRGWAAGRIRREIQASTVTRTSPWIHLGQLGERTGVAELSELAATISLAGTEGAKVRTSLEAKARAMRRRQLTEAEGAAQAATERMALPIVLQFLGFLIFIGTPALSAVLAGL
ncbi:type II secretion system F family protein [Streptomyces radicis]|uniref:Type II secretion protein F n=1 Tax=Streptomyces radicis TaxID=1750517 RepID=A0A3A9WG26_9ACTN|nr:type II secretion system F family protein [Streptomyces radicis]RKN11572.1 type II secretion protein F [Streptomyces radicis]RKN26410.1 type II secretion protein F [Streptomyces radicis]